MRTAKYSSTSCWKNYQPSSSSGLIEQSTQQAKGKTVNSKITSAVGALAVAIGTAMTVGSGTATADSVINGCTIVDSPTKTRYTNCPGADFTGADLSQVNLMYANVPDAKFSGANFGVGRGLHAFGANLSGADFADTDMSKSGLDSANLNGAVFKNTKLISASMTYATINDADFDGADLTRATIRGSKLDRSSMAGVALTDADLSGTNLDKVNLRDANLSFANLENAVLTSTKISGANFADARITKAYFYGSEITPNNIVVPADRPSSGAQIAGANVSWTMPAGIAGLTVSNCNPASGSFFGERGSIVSCQVRNQSTGVQTVGAATFTVIVNPYVDNGGTGSLGSLPFGS
ncbi:pentapeptide repeat-containing protein [Rhodococcus sp. GB-02]